MSDELDSNSLLQYIECVDNHYLPDDTQITFSGCTTPNDPLRLNGCIEKALCSIHTTNSDLTNACQGTGAVSGWNVVSGGAWCKTANCNISDFEQNDESACCVKDTTCDGYKNRNSASCFDGSKYPPDNTTIINTQLSNNILFDDSD